MNTDPQAVVDTLNTCMDRDGQRMAARWVQEVFAETFRLAVDIEPSSGEKAMLDLEKRCRNWCQAGADEQVRALRLALLISGLDQWGLAYSQAFGLQAIPMLSALIGTLRTQLEPKVEARFQQFFSQIDAIESDAIDFKIELRRNIHLALWAAMGACETIEASEPILRALGSMMLALNARMPTLGWRLLADALASIQICLLNDPKASTVARDGTQQLFESLRQALPDRSFKDIMAYSTQAVLGWQQSRRPN